MSPFEKICWYWAVYNDFALDFCGRVQSSRVLSIRASELFDGAVTPRIFDFLGVRRPPKKAIDKVLDKKLNAQQEGTFPEAEEWTPEMHETLRRIAGRTMEQLGYSLKDITAS